MDLKLKTLFNKYNVKYFENKLENVLVSWSDKMTLCTGKTYLLPKSESRNCRIRLSNPLLSQRPFEDTLNTLLHEMIHAYLYITKAIGPRQSHSEDFKCLMNKINADEGSKIKIRHNFHNEVNKFRTNIYKCNGPCRNWRPCFGILRRAISRPPGPVDHWWERHANECGGTFIKVENEINSCKQLNKLKKEYSLPLKVNDHSKNKCVSNKSYRIREIKRTKFSQNFDPFAGGHTLVTAHVNGQYKTEITKYRGELQKYVNQFDLWNQSNGNSLVIDEPKLSVIEREQHSSSPKEKFEISKYINRLKVARSSEICDSFTGKEQRSSNLKEKFPINKYIKRLEDYKSAESNLSQILNDSVKEFSNNSHSQNEKNSYSYVTPEANLKCSFKSRHNFADAQKTSNPKSENCDYESYECDKLFPTVVCRICKSLINEAEYNFHLQFCTKSL